MVLKEHSMTALLVNRSDQLEELVQHILNENLVAVDTESNSLFAYQEQVCLIQFSTAHMDALVDPFAVDDLSPLGVIFAEPNIEKIFHAAEYDLFCLHRDFQFQFDKLFDTMLAARILGRKQIGLGSLLEAEFGIKLNKRFQRANWGMRPLSNEMLAYAQDDTHYLIPLREKLWDELQTRNLMPLAQEDFERLIRVNGHENATNNKCDEIWRIHGAQELSPDKAAVLNELVLFRDRMARKLDRPLFKVLSDQTLLNLARSCPTNLDELGRMAGISLRQIDRYGNGLIQAIQRGLRNPPLYPNHNNRPSDEYLERLEKLRHWRKTTAVRMGVPSDVVLPRDVLLRLVQNPPHDQAQLAQSLWDVPWRLEHFGSQILSLFQRN
ncbi:MAG: ribonuclease D [Anaerolineales bacterium]